MQHHDALPPSPLGHNRPSIASNVEENLMVPVKPDSEATCRLLERIQEGDSAAFEELLARHRPLLRQLVEIRLDSRLRARVDPSDIVQDAHLEAYRRMADFLQRKPMPFRLWLQKTA